MAGTLSVPRVYVLISPLDIEAARATFHHDAIFGNKQVSP